MVGGILAFGCLCAACTVPACQAGGVCYWVAAPLGPPPFPRNATRFFFDAACFSVYARVYSTGGAAPAPQAW